MLTKVYHIGIICQGPHAGNKKPRDIGVFRVQDSEGEFEVMCPHCRRMVWVCNRALSRPIAYPEVDGLRYQDVTNQFQGK